VLLLGLAGAGLVLLAMRQGWAHVTTTAPRPLPASTTTVAGQDLVPAADALAVAAVASLAAVLATRRLLRRITGIVLAGFGAGIAVAVSAGISAADVLAAAAGTAGPSTGTGAGAGAGSVTAGSTPAGAGVPLTGFPGHAALAALPWRGVAIAGALAVIAAGVLVTWRAERLPVMSGRYDLPTGAAGPVRAAGRPAPAGAAPVPPVPAPAPPAPVPPVAAALGQEQPVGASATIWESLSRGEDPTSPAPEPAAGDARGNNGNTGIDRAAEPGHSARR
jgi:Tryptophan-associated transmembrane protein (Trp_oprn_chp)